MALGAGLVCPPRKGPPFWALDVPGSLIIRMTRRVLAEAGFWTLGCRWLISRTPGLLVGHAPWDRDPTCVPYIAAPVLKRMTLVGSFLLMGSSA